MRDNVISYDSFHWNWSQSCVCDDAIFAASRICNGIENAIQWPNAEKRVVASKTLLQSLDCISFIDGTLVEI